ncbi:hypothetical protein A2706_01910 [Candidatus Peribacteria bacterium RIFCSPHIGHO2_01_FULL_51_35]|nr:MAG: hypothetical protein A2706_01910 [Candidatus Peribacteria bacterium RIFCSPHIGHO2_01_FULL_51_35]
MIEQHDSLPAAERNTEKSFLPRAIEGLRHVCGRLMGTQKAEPLTESQEVYRALLEMAPRAKAAAAFSNHMLYRTKGHKMIY